VNVSGEHIAAIIAVLFTFYHYLTVRELRRIYRRIADALERLASNPSQHETDEDEDDKEQDQPPS